MPKLGSDTVLLFYKDYETDKWIRGDRYLKQIIRPLYNRLHRRQKVTGFLVAYHLLVKALRQQGLDVRSNDYAAARRHPEHPVGLFGYPQQLDGWSLPNPAVLGPGLFDHPKLAPGLMEDPRNRFYVVTSEWVRRMFAPYYGDSCVVWFAGVDLKEWPDAREHPKDIDVLIYDKIHWDRGHYERELVRPIQDRLARDGVRTETIRYKQYDHGVYRQTLARSRSMLFLGEHETMGLAYQEALASNVPVLAWDNGYWLDPQRLLYEAEPVPASSVPYFSEGCGERFRDSGEFDAAFERFWSRLDSYEPRRFVAGELSQEKSAQLYMEYYRQAAQPRGHP
ncbi:MAG: hypothetical protein M3P24_11510 [Gemmatimonadota bacterium]|nr:hypothetical protein [Gemmatimonadota bacterium]